MKTINLAFSVLFLTFCGAGCFSEKSKKGSAVQAETNQMSGLPPTSVPLIKAAATEIFRKDQREAIYFSASLEKEALKILTKNSQFDELTLFSVLSYALETSYGVKKTPPSRLDCSRFRFSEDLNTKGFSARKVSVFKTCQRPESLIAEIGISANQSELSITFLSKEWIPVLGLSATLSGANVQCQLRLEKKKLAGLVCENWIRTVGVTNVSAEELRLKTFVFDRSNAHQFVLKGGLYKDLVERKKIEIDVPLEGKIKRFEKEIEVIDQYADSVAETAKPTTQDASATRMQVLPVDSATAPVPAAAEPEAGLEVLDNGQFSGVPVPRRKGR